MRQPLILLGYEAKCFEAWRFLNAEMSVMGFDAVARRTGCPRDKVRRAVRGLARKGLIAFYRTSWTEDGVPNGAGYGLTPAGVEHLKATEDVVNCEGCGRLIEIGDPVSAGADAGYFCEDCTPHIADLLDFNNDSFLDAEGQPLSVWRRRELYDELIDQGKQPSDRFGIRLYGDNDDW